MDSNQTEAQLPHQSSVTDAVAGSESATTTGSFSEQDKTSTTVDSGKITATSSLSKKTNWPERQIRHEKWMKMRLEEDRAIEEQQRRSSNEDLVNKPSHYNQAGIECIEAIEASLGPEGFQSYLTGNCLKYLWRWKYKNGLQDLKKCRVYLDWLIRVSER